MGIFSTIWAILSGRKRRRVVDNPIGQERPPDLHPPVDAGQGGAKPKEEEQVSIDPTMTYGDATKLKKQVVKDLDRHEGYRFYAYPDPLSDLMKRYPNERWGFVPAMDILTKLKISYDDAVQRGRPWTVGFGFTDGVNPLSTMPRLQAERKLEEHIVQADLELGRTLTWYNDSPFVVKTVLINMRFNLGLKGLLGFRNTLEYMKNKQWINAAAGMRKSLWYRQVGQRAEELARRIETQSIPHQFKAGD